MQSLVNKAAAAAATAAAQPLVDFTPGSDMLDPVLQVKRTDWGFSLARALGVIGWSI